MVERRHTLARRTVTIGVFAGLSAVVAGTDSGGRGKGPVPARRAGPAPATGRALTPGRLPPAVTGATLLRSGPELPRGGRTLFPAYRLAGFCGSPGASALGRLGIGDVDLRAAEIERLAGQYAAGRTGQPVFELIVVVAQPVPGPDGGFRVRIDPSQIEYYLAAARRHRALLLLNIQPGRARFLDEVRALARWLAEPDVGLALDPEWAVGPGQVPGRVFGRTSWAELDQVAGFVSALVAAHDLPDKALVVHQLADRIIRPVGRLRPHPGVEVIKSVDGIGTPAEKVATWRRLTRWLPTGVHPGFKLFFEEDSRGGSRLMTPAQVLALTPTPQYVMYE